MPRQARELKEGLALDQDFIVRRRSRLWLQLGTLIVVAFGVMYLSSAWLLKGGSVPLLHSLILLVVLILLGVIGYLQVQRHRDLLLMTEFQNALFTSVARLNYRFYLIVKKDGSIVYYDPGFQHLFPDVAQQSHKMLDHMFDRKHVPTEMSQEINRLLQAEEQGVMLLPFTAPDGVQMTLVLHVDPLPKPKGYIAVRGREYVDRREGAMGGQIGTAAPAPAPGRASPDLLNMLVEQSATAAYAINAEGSVVFVNAAMEKTLGYGTGEMLGKPAGAFVYQASGTAGFSQDNDAFEGDALFLHRNGGMVKYFVRQSSWLNAAGQRLGCYGYLTPLDEAPRTNA